MGKRFVGLWLWVCMGWLCGLGLAQPVIVAGLVMRDQFRSNNTVWVQRASASTFSFIVVTTDRNGRRDALLAVHPLPAGTYQNIDIPINGALATQRLHVSLYQDTNGDGAYSPTDALVTVGSVPLSARVRYLAVYAADQLTAGSLSATVTSDVNGFLVVHTALNSGNVLVSGGAALGSAPVRRGTQTLTVPFSAPDVLPTRVLFPTLYQDSNANGIWDSADLILRVRDQNAVVMMNNGPALRVNAQLLLAGDNVAAPLRMTTRRELTIAQVAIDRAGFLVVYNDGGGRPGARLGVMPLRRGAYQNITLTLNGVTASDGRSATPAVPRITSILFPVLHYDTDENGEFEYAGGELDAPVVVNGGVLIAPINVGPSFSIAAQPIRNGTLTAQQIIIDAPGFLVIHEDAGGRPGVPLGVLPVPVGVWHEQIISLTAGPKGSQVFPMLHYDTNGDGRYSAADIAPVVVDLVTLVTPLALTER
jgi:hypothetical protein